MTKIKMLNDRIIFDGHADSRQECETITLMCDNLAKSKDFKTVRYESGYAEFEKVGKTEELKFVSGPPCSCTMIFDDGVVSVACTQDAMGSQPSFTWNNSGESNTGAFEGLCIFPVTLAPGRILNTVVSSEYNSQVEIGENQFQGWFTTGADFTITITTKAAATKQTIDVSTLAGWANLATGNHQITIKTKASGYVDSAASNAVTVSKAASGYSVSVERYETYDEQSYEYSTDNGTTWNSITGEGQIVASTKQIKFRVTGTAEAAEASIHSLLLDMDIQFSSPGDAVGTWHYSENYTLTQNIDDIVCIPYL